MTASNEKKEVGLGKEFGLDSTEAMVSHWFLHSGDVVERVADTPEWRDEHRLVARVTVNGVELRFEDLDHLLLEFHERRMRELDARYADPRRAAEEAALAILKDRAEGITDAMEDLQNVLGDASSLIRPHWERDGG